MKQKGIRTGNFFTETAGKQNREQLGIPMSTAIDMYLKQISLVGGIPFSVVLPKSSVSTNADAMTVEELHAKLDKGYADIEAGNVEDAASAFARFRETRG